MFSKLEAKLQSFLDMGIPGYEICIYKGGKEIYRKRDGYSSIKDGVPIVGGELYNVYSCTKPVTVTAAMMLVERGLMSLDDKLSAYLPEFEKMYVKCEGGVREAKTPITIKNLFTMTAGFNYNMECPAFKRAYEETGGRCPTREVMKYFAKEPLEFDPGEKFLYSLCHDVLAAVVEVVSGERFGEFVKKNIFDVAGMSESTFLPTEELLPKIAGHYRHYPEANEVREIGKKIIDRLGSEYESGGAGLLTSVGDYIKFLEALRTGKLVKPETLALMTSNQLTPEQEASKGVGDYSYGLGLRVPAKDGVTDFGWGGAAGAYLAIDPKNELSIFYAQHVFCYHNRDRDQIIKLVKEALGCK